MDLSLARFHIDSTGAFSYLTRDDTNSQVCVTGSHTYQDDSGNYAPVTPPGRFWCQRGTHTIRDPLPNAPNNYTTFETFEITGIDGHTGVLFHWGNLPKEQSEGCELTGMSFGALDSEEAVLNSKVAFDALMELQIGADGFWLTVK